MRLLSLATLMLSLACASCVSAPAGPAPASANIVAPAQGPEATLAQIRALVGPAACSDAAQCRTLPLGAKSCGGPEAYVAWSSAATAEAPLQQLAARYRSERQQLNERSGMVSDCRLLTDPGAVCRAGSCQLRPGDGERS